MRIAVLNSYSTTIYRDSVADYSKYYYKISAFSLSEESDYSPVESCQRLPSTPTNLTSQSYNTHVALTWDPASGAEYYRVYRGTSSSSSPLLDSTTQPYYNDSSLTTSTKYYYRVSAVNKGGESGKSSYVYAGIIIKPSAPYNLTGSGTTAHIYLSWSQNSSDDVDGFVIYRSNDSGATYSPVDTSLSNRNYYDYVVDGKLYYYQVSAYNSVGESDRSNAVSARRLTPETPSSIYIGSEQFRTHIPISWSSSTGATGYNVYRSLSADSGYIKLATIQTTAYNDSSALANTIYYYKISAYSTVGESPLSDYVSGKKLSVVPPSEADRNRVIGLQNFGK
jgi:fibronectin type 3 domain-containing protein